MLDDADRRDIQGLVTTGFGHLDQACILLLDVRERARGKAWLKGILPRVTTAAPWPKDADGNKVRPRRTCNLALASPALEVLGLPAEARNSLPAELVVGMASRADVLGDRGESAPDRWDHSAPGVGVGTSGATAGSGGASGATAGPPEGGEAGGGPSRFNALVVVYAETREAVDEELVQLRASLGPEQGVVEVAAEHGGENTTFKEHFGFSADGLSQPIVQGIRSEHAEASTWVVRTGEFVLGYLNELGHYPPSPGVSVDHDPQGMLPPFPEGGLPGFRDFGRNGTYLVYRKLYQDVARFWRYVQSRVGEDGATGREAEMLRLAAKLMGRWPSGAPLVLAPDHDDPSLGYENDFMYRPTDPDGLACPIGAHIRRANPRDSFRRIADTVEESIRTSNQHRILRRGFSYGPPLFPKEQVADGRAPAGLDDDGQPRGLHFMAVNTDIQRQFEFIQETWLNNGKFNGLYDNKDPFLGDNDGTGTMVIPRRPVRRRVGGVPRFVHVRGGGYLFMPGMTALRYLAEAP